MGFGLPSAILAAWLGTPAKRQAQWIFGAAASLIGALGVFGMQDAATFLISWEIMSLGGAVMLLGENLSSDVGRPALFMLALLEAGAVALILAFILLANQAGSLSFSDFAAAMRALPLPEQYFVALLLLIGFGAKLGLLPFYEWFPGGLWLGKRGDRRISFRRRPQCRLLFPQPLFPRMAADHRRDGQSRCRASLSSPPPSRARFSPRSTRSRKKDGGSLLSLSSAENGSIAVCLARRCADVPSGRARRPRGPRLDRRAYPFGGSRARERAHCSSPRIGSIARPEATPLSNLDCCSVAHGRSDSARCWRR